ncbi:hypothetical protein BST83_11475 [Polaribacter filamentus]|uniref:Sulfatase N-terminal domain-containing protein n=1 Tax=Polaribacter filamentus TaxID=53483 RepID=A0A2S7KZ02_9FLAO|nr:sulfatase-like hydrolase/transferase [Polaribacter filamentus]PQB07708.1 hypothetical protein BST83_11475 [Polaribacter filamentus]
MKFNLSIIAIAILSFYVTNSFAQTSKRPNIIFIMTDDQSAIVPKKEDGKKVHLEGETVQSHPFGFNGDSEVHTPIIDALANQGMIFNNAFVSSSVCSPSRYTMLTGRYASRSEGPSFMKLHPYGKTTRVENNTELEMNRENLPRLLQKVGYKTGFVGKSHIIDHDLLNQKWDSDREGLLSYEQDADPKDPEINAAMKHNHNFWAGQIKKYGFDYANGVYAANLRELYNDSLNVHNIEWKNKAALEFIDNFSDEPFFLYYSEMVPHGPAPWIKKNGKYLYSLDANPKMTGAGYLDMKFENMPSRKEILDEVMAAGKDPDHAWLRWFDHAVGAVVKKLKEKGIYENTIIVVTSDHGNYNLGKTTIYEGGIKVPLMIHWPNGIKTKSSYDELVQNIDFTPTFLDLAGVNLKKIDAVDGVSLKKVFQGNKKAVHDYLYFELGYARGIRTKDWKYITLRYDEKAQKQIDNGVIFKGWNGHVHALPYYTRNSHLGYHAAKLNPFYFDANQLFDLRNDPDETINIFDLNSKKAEAMKKLLIKSLKSFPNRPYGEFVNY